MINILSYMLYPELTYSFSHILSAYMVSLSYTILTTNLTAFIFGHTKWLLCLLEQFLYSDVIQFQLHLKSSTKVKFKKCMNREWIKMDRNSTIQYLRYNFKLVFILLNMLTLFLSFQLYWWSILSMWLD